MKRKRRNKGLTLVELLVVVNILAVLAGTASIALSEYGDEAKSLEVYNIFPQIIRSQKFYVMKNDRYYAANHNQFKNYGVDVSEAEYFSYSTFPDEVGTFSIRADAGPWAEGGWVQFDQMGDPPWRSDGVFIKQTWLPN
jgi:prepilin-type N-terminal cleavage/methylation domain-containing protein